MFYAWATTVEFSNADASSARGRSLESVMKKMADYGYKRFFTAHQLDGAWVDLTTHGPGLDPEGRPVSEERERRYLRGRKRALDAHGMDEITQATPMPDVAESTPAEELAPNYQQAQGEQRQQVALGINPVQVKAIFQFLALEKEQREAAIEALAALSVSAEAFKSAVGVMLEPNLDLVVSINDAGDEQQ